MMRDDTPVRGELWLGHLGRTRGQEQGGKRPLLVVSVSQYNLGPSELVVVCPLTTRRWNIPWHCEIEPPEGGLDRTSYVMCDQLRTVTAGRLSRRFEEVTSETMDEVEDRLRILLDL